jgi:PAS domain S-box-containing protein
MIGGLGALEVLLKAIENMKHELMAQGSIEREALLRVIDQLAAFVEEGERQTLEFKEIANHLYDGIYISDGEGKTLFINKAYTRITGITPEMILGKNVKEITEKYMLYKNAVTLKVIKEKKRVDSIGESLLNNQKMLITGNPIFDEAGNVKRVVINNREWTDLESLKAQLDNSNDKLQIFSEENRKKTYELSHLRTKQRDSKAYIGSSEQYEGVRKLIELISPTDATVLITGATGTGKEVVANEIVKYSTRKDKPYIKINCSAIPGNLLESELFGYEKGSFTGANKEGKMGLFEIAHTGTLLLDEIGDMPMDLQSKMLRVLQEREVKRIGSYKSIPIDVRILAATNKDIQAAVADGKFREDLYYRLNVIPIKLPTLSDRVDDIDIFLTHFVTDYNRRYAKSIAFDNASTALLKQYSWPGNVREFKNIIERIVIIARQSEDVYELLSQMLHIDVIPATFRMDKSYKEMVNDFERQLLSKALKEFKTTTNAAKHLKLDQSTIVKKKQRLGL